MARPILIKGNIDNFVSRNDGAVLRPKVAGDLYLNNMAKYIVELLYQDKYNVDEIVEIITSNYEVLSKEKVKDDLMKLLKILWERALVYFKGHNPFIDEITHIIDEKRKIVKLSVDNFEYIIKGDKSNIIFSDPYFNYEEIFQEDNLAYLLMNHLWYGYVFYEDNVLSHIVIMEASGCYLTLSCIYANEGKLDSGVLKEIIRFAFKENGQSTIIASIDIKHKEIIPILTKGGFIDNGTLKDEVKQGDLKVFVFSETVG